uniref:ZP domain-containing protein n=1 Tax=Ciona savignyi TaxID=51511 RepID=H2Y8X5_CIOSA
MKELIGIIIFCALSTYAQPTINCTMAPYFRLDNDTLSKLKATGNDTLAISLTCPNSTDTIKPECKTTADNPRFMFNLTKCPANYTTNGTHLTVSYYIWNMPHLNKGLVVQRYKALWICLVCVFPKKQMIEFGKIIPQIQKIKVFQAMANGQFLLDLGFYASSNYTTKLLAGANINVPNNVYAKILLVGVPRSVTSFIVQTIQCWATDVNDPNAPRRYDLISHSCPADMYTWSTRNYNSTYATFHFSSFTWTNVSLSIQAIYVHCMVCICDLNLNATCNSLTCAPRIRRDVSTKASQTISAGPLYITPHHTPNLCDQSGCSDICTMIGGMPVCSCTGGMMLADNLKTCVAPADDVFSSKSMFYILGISVVLVVGAYFWKTK